MLGRIPKNGCLTREFAKRKSQARRYAFIIEKHLLKLILFTTQSNNLHPTLSQIAPPVATTPTRIWLIFWNQPKITVTLLSLRQAAPQQSKASFDCIRLALSLHQLFESYVSFSFCINLF